MPTIHGDVEFVQKKVGAALRELKELGILTDANVAAANTVAGIRTTVSTGLAAATVHGELSARSADLLRAIDIGKETGALTDAGILSLTTVDSLIALTGNTNTSERSYFNN